MVRYGQFVIGPAGSGKSTYCSIMNDHILPNQRSVNFINLGYY